MLSENIRDLSGLAERVVYNTAHPHNVIIVEPSEFDVKYHRRNLQHCQKPVNLMRRLVRTYTNEDDVVLDFSFGSGTTAVACHLEGRKFIGIEKDKENFQRGVRRVLDVIARTGIKNKDAAD
jgi:DNA modification methylase